MPILMPDIATLPPSPARDLVAAMHELYTASGRPGARRISAEINGDTSIHGSVSHQTVALFLRGKVIPSWSKVECLALILAKMAVHNPDIKSEVALIHELWVAANDDEVTTSENVASTTADEIRQAILNSPNSGASRDADETLQEVKSLLFEFGKERGSYQLGTRWDELDTALQLDLVAAICKELENGDQASLALLAAQNINSRLSPDLRSQVESSIVHAMRNNPNTAVRRQAAWDLRWMWAPDSEDTWRALESAMHDDDTTVADHASSSLAFRVEDSVSTELWDKVTWRIAAMYRSDDETLVDAALFFYYKLLERASGLADLTLIEKCIRESMQDGRAEIRKRAYSLLPEILPRLPREQSLHWMTETTQQVSELDAETQYYLADAWRLILWSPTRRRTYDRNRLSDDLGAEISALLVPKLLELISCDYSAVRDVSWYALEHAGSVLPRRLHQAVLDTVSQVAQYDRAIELKHLRGIVDNYVGLIPESLQRAIERKEQAHERDLNEY